MKMGIESVCLHHPISTVLVALERKGPNLELRICMCFQTSDLCEWKEREVVVVGRELWVYSSYGGSEGLRLGKGIGR